MAKLPFQFPRAWRSYGTGCTSQSRSEPAHTVNNSIESSTGGRCAGSALKIIPGISQQGLLRCVCRLQGPKGELQRTFSPLVKFDTLVRAWSRLQLVRLSLVPCSLQRCLLDLSSSARSNLPAWWCRRTDHIGCIERKTLASRTCSTGSAGLLGIPAQGTSTQLTTHAVESCCSLLEE